MLGAKGRLDDACATCFTSRAFFWGGLALLRSLFAAALFAVFCSACGSSTGGPASPDAMVDADSADADAADATVDAPVADGAPQDAGRPPPAAHGLSAGCGMVAAETGALERVIGVADLERQYIVVLPESYDPERAYALVFAYHGLGDNYRNFAAALAFEGYAGEDAILVYPQGTPSLGGQNGWVFGAEERDLAFFDALYATLTDELCVDLGSVHAVGFSFGGYMSNALACHRGEVLRGIGVMSGALPSRAGCSGRVAAMVVHGNADTVVSLSLGRAAQLHWGRTNGCAIESEPTGLEGCEARLSCDEGYPVVFCRHDGAHVVPFWAPGAIWDFLAALPAPQGEELED